MTIETLGVDIAKNVFQLHGVNRNGRVVLKRRVMRDQLLEVLAQIDQCTVVVEACTGAFYWARKFESSLSVLHLPSSRGSLAMAEMSITPAVGCLDRADYERIVSLVASGDREDSARRRPLIEPFQ